MIVLSTRASRRGNQWREDGVADGASGLRLLPPDGGPIPLPDSGLSRNESEDHSPEEGDPTQEDEPACI